MTAARKRPPADLLSLERQLARYPRPGRTAPAVFAGFPAPYAVGMSNLGFQFLLDALRRSGAFRVERFFAGGGGRTLETGAPLDRAAVLFCSISWEEDYVLLARTLSEAGIEPLRERRTGGPVIVAGGAAVSGNPMPVSAIVDAVVLGEGEGPVETITRRLPAAAAAGRESILETILSIEGVMQPGGAGRFAAPADPDMFPRSTIVSPETVFPDTLLVEVARGCPGRCAFCLATALYGPWRTMPPGRFEEILDGASGSIARVGLVSTAVAAHPGFGDLVEAALVRGMTPSFSSLRAEDIDGRTAALIGRAGTRSAALAPESGSERIRRIVGKRVPDERYLEAAGLLAEAGVRRLTLYFLVGLPGEDGAAFEETDRFLSAMARAAAPARLSAHVNTVVQKAWTPMQFHHLPPAAEIASRMGRIERACRRLGIAVKLKSIRSSLRQAVLGAGDEAVGRAVVRLAAGGISWRKALAVEGVDRDLPHRPRRPGERLPWDALAGPAVRDALERRWRRIGERTGRDG